MAIFGMGSKWGDNELTESFFEREKITIGWNEGNGNDVHYLLASIKIGDLIYIKSNRPGSRDLKIKGIGIVNENFIEYLKNNGISAKNFIEADSLTISVRWIHKQEFLIEIPKEMGKLTNIRATTLYEEYLPFVQKKIIEKLFPE